MSKVPVPIHPDVLSSLASSNGGDSGLAVVATTSMPLHLAMQKAERAWSTVTRDPRSLLPYVSDVAPTPEGAATWWEDRSEAKVTLDAWAQALADEGFADGLIRLHHQQTPIVRAAWSCPMIEARLAVPARFDPSRRVSAWTVADELVRQLASTTQQWCDRLSAGADSYLECRMITSKLPHGASDDVVVEAANATNRGTALDSAWYVAETGSGEFRAVKYELASGYASLVASNGHDDSFDVERTLDAIREGMLETAPLVNSGFAKRTLGWDLVGGRSLERWSLPIGQFDDRSRDDHSVPDAFGMLLLPDHDQQRDRVPLPRWTATRIGERLLLESSDHHGWFGNYVPETSLLATSRQELAPLLR